MNVARWPILFILGFTSILAGGDEVHTILLVGDSWAASIATQHHDAVPPGFGTFDALLKQKGYGAWRTRGNRTAWGGRTAQFWARHENLRVIREELAADPSIACIHLIVGGNDFLALVQDTPPDELRQMTLEQRRSRFWTPIVTNIRTILETVLGERHDVRVLLAGYDYLDPRAMEHAYGFDFHGASTDEVNCWLQELGTAANEAVQHLATGYPGRVFYLENWGTLQRSFGGECVGPAGGLPIEAQVGDGVHPNDAGHRALLENAFSTYYNAWVAKEATAQERDGEPRQVTAERRYCHDEDGDD